MWSGRYGGKTLLLASAQRCLEAENHGFKREAIVTLHSASDETDGFGLEARSDDGIEGGVATTPGALDPMALEHMVLERLSRTVRNPEASRGETSDAMMHVSYAWSLKIRAKRRWRKFSFYARTPMPDGDYRLSIVDPRADICVANLSAGEPRLGQAANALDVALSGANALIVCLPLFATTTIDERHALAKLLDRALPSGPLRTATVDTLVVAFTYYDHLHLLGQDDTRGDAIDRAEAAAIVAKVFVKQARLDLIQELAKRLATITSTRGAPLACHCVVVGSFGFLEPDGRANVDAYARLEHPPRGDDPRRGPLMPEPRPEPRSAALSRAAILDRAEGTDTHDTPLSPLVGRERWRPFHSADPVIIAATGRPGTMAFTLDDILLAAER